MGSTYCEVSSNWTENKPFSVVITYSFIDGGLDNKDFDSDSLRLTSDHEVQLSKTEEDEHCNIYISCPNPVFASVNGFIIISESRTLEISNKIQGYVTTVRGQQLNTEKNKNSNQCLYSCRCLLDEDYSNLNVKFLSLGDRTSFCIRSIIINVSQCTESRSAPARGTFSISKLKKDVNQMGEIVSDRAKDLLTTMEQFEENKFKSFPALVMAQNVSGQQSSLPLGQGLSGIMNSILGVETMKSLKKSCGSTSDCGSNDADMYEMLEAVCGSVGKMRVAAAKEQERLHAQSDSGVESTSQTPTKFSDQGDDSHLDIFATIIDQKINQAKSDLQSEFSDFKMEITNKLDEVTNTMNEKLDVILCMLTNIQKANGAEQEVSQPKTAQEYQSGL